VAEKIPYLVDLGVEALYLNPVFASTANHRYHTTDYLQVDPVLGVTPP
jgi:cyclomaltodextrinase